MTSVDQRYRHFAKLARYLGPRSVTGGLVKLYHLAAAEHAVSAEVGESVDRWLAAGADDIVSPGDRGFVIVHRCGEDFHFVLVSVWRDNNELWEAVWSCEGEGTIVSPFEVAYPSDAGRVRPTYCVWELGIVTHESACWERYLRSDRDDMALTAWQTDGVVV